MSAQIRRRGFIKQLSAGLLTTGIALNSSAKSNDRSNIIIPKRKKFINTNPNVALIKGTDRKTNMYDALKLIENDVRESIGDKQVVIKPNFTRVDKENWLASTHADNVHAVLEFLKPFYKKKVIIAEGAGGAEPIAVPVENYGYDKLKENYDVSFYDLSKDTYSTVSLMDSNIQPMPISTSNLLLDQNNYIISAAVMKTHNLAVVTLGLKNIVLASPMNFGGRNNERRKLHKDRVADDPRYFNYNMFRMAQYTYPDLVIIDGFVGMEGKGPLFGDPIEVGVAIASTDCIATDRVGTDVMGHDFNNVGHLVHCANAKMGEGDITKINLLGDKISTCQKNFKRTDDWEKIIHWK
ncbi:DUF362 domain-containing protein [Bacteroidota bacterium]